MSPLVILLIGVVLIVALIIFLRLNAFLALLLAALVVSFLAGPPVDSGGDWSACVSRVGVSLGTFAGKVGIVIAMGALIGSTMMYSGAADRIVLAICRLFGEKRVPGALLCSGFVLSIPVFYDTTLFLLIPLARSVYKRVRKNYLLYLTAIGAGATITHVLVPPTPGPLMIAERLDVPLGTMFGVSLLVAACLAPISLAISYFVNWYLPNPKLLEDESDTIEHDRNENDADSSTPDSRPGLASRPEITGEKALPSLWIAFVPLVLPVVLIAAQSISSVYVRITILDVLGKPEIALLLGAIFSMGVLLSRPGMSFPVMQEKVEHTLLSAALIVLITSAGGAFGDMLKEADVGEAVAALFRNEQGHFSGPILILMSFLIAALIKTAQGSSTTAMITAAGVVGSMNIRESLDFNIAYIAVAIGCGSIVVGWMNDSGFWAFCRMGRVSETDAMKTWTVQLGLMGVAGMLIALAFSRILPLT